MNTAAAYFRVTLFMTIAYLLLEFTLAPGEEHVVIKYPIVWAVLGMLILLSIAVEIISSSLKSILWRGLDEAGKERYQQAEAKRKDKRFGWIKRTYNKLVGGKPIEQEGEIILDHNYDGIKELDNNLPPWWVYGFYATIIFAAVYLARYHVFDGTDQTEEYEIEMAEARLAIEEYKKTAKDLVDVNTVALLTDPSDLSAGKAIFTTNCVACHKADGGGGIGPNLTDEYWILGGGIKNVFNTIMEGGRDGKGMVSWKSELKPSEVAQVSSYLLTFQGTTPAEPKAPEGEIWVDPDTPAEANEEIQEVVVDSTAAEISMNN
ncbi:MAG: c-type cytochrome [Flavobacteriaceae bacterium]|nr:c-type cytochrome [Flavobacteriaceae bacterium]